MSKWISGAADAQLEFPIREFGNPPGPAGASTAGLHTVRRRKQHVSRFVTFQKTLDQVRARHGIFFTPPPLVDRLLDMIEATGHDWSTGLFLDPAAGGGAFLAPVATRTAAQLASKGFGATEIISQIEK